MKASLFLIASFALAAAAQPDRKDAGKDEARELEGKWNIASLVEDGKVEEDRGTYVFKGDQVTFQIGGGKERTGPFKLDTKKSPKWIDMGPKGEILGIYELKGDMLRLCILAGPGKKRPAEFKSTREGGETLIELKRAKP
jgi:uncharacterized protein (TIGR03067 family)